MNDFYVGDKVVYIPDNTEGIVKAITRENFCFVVFNCNNDWDNYQQYTAQNCKINDLRIRYE